MLTLGRFVEGSGGDGGGGRTGRFSCSNANSQTDVGLENACYETLGGSTRNPKSVNFLEGDDLNALAMYGRQVGDMKKYSMVFVQFQSIGLSTRSHVDLAT